MNNSIFHDANVKGVEYEDQSKSLILKLQLDDKKVKRLIFHKVYDFNFESFGSQNILFDLVQYGQDRASLSEILLLFPGLTSKAIQFVKDNKYIVYILEPSIGMTGYIIAPEFTIAD